MPLYQHKQLKLVARNIKYQADLYASTTERIKRQSLYYTLFYISNALLVDKGMFAKTHAGVIAKINEHFVKTGILSRDEGRTISILQNMCQSGDYDACFEWSEEDVFPFFKRTEELLLKIESLLNIK